MNALRAFKTIEITGEVAERVLSKLAPCPVTGHWFWYGSINQQGYGYARIHGDRYQAHRLVFEMVHGRIPAGMELDHVCRERACVNPDHLEPVTHAENLRRGLSPIALNSWGSQTCKRGHSEWLRNSNGRRQCAVCSRERARKYWPTSVTRRKRLARAVEGETHG